MRLLHKSRDSGKFCFQHVLLLRYGMSRTTSMVSCSVEIIVTNLLTVPSFLLVIIGNTQLGYDRVWSGKLTYRNLLTKTRDSIYFGSFLAFWYHHAVFVVLLYDSRFLPVEHYKSFIDLQMKCKSVWLIAVAYTRPYCLCPIIYRLANRYPVGWLQWCRLLANNHGFFQAASRRRKSHRPKIPSYYFKIYYAWPSLAETSSLSVS